MVALKELSAAFDALNLAHRPVIAHASLKAFGVVDGGAYTLVEAMQRSFHRFIMPAHTYKTMITPPTGPVHNGLTYGAEDDLNRMAEYWSPDMTVDKMMGIVPEILRRHPKAKRSSHPILSFTGIGADDILETQTLAEPLAPIGELAKRGGYVVLLGVDHTVNTSVHYAEKLAGRKQFTRWALTNDGIVACPNFPGDSSGFEVLNDNKQLKLHHTRKIKVGEAAVTAISLEGLFKVVQHLIQDEPTALLCTRDDCPRCSDSRYWAWKKNTTATNS